MGKKSLRAGVLSALGNQQIQDALDAFTSSYLEKRRRLLPDVAMPDLQTKVRHIKEEAIENMLELAQVFIARAKDAGMRVWEAQDAEEACRITAGVARQYGAGLVVKSKSMVSEEIRLNDYLARQDLEVLETDLGERIIQLAGEGPSHMVMPAIHKNRREVARLLSSSYGRSVEPEIASMVREVREELRQGFFRASLGVSGANFLLAGSGTLVVLSNEGNARLVLNLPPVTVTLVGYEKLLPGWDELARLLPLLPPAATGQRLTSYVNFISSTRENAEAHVVLLDNGRLAMQADSLFKEALYCLRCGSCLNVCPVYRVLGGQVFGHIYMGGIGAILTAFFHPDEDPGLGDLCLGCGRCREYCPAGIDIPGLILELRRRQVKDKGLSWPWNLAIRGFLSRPRLFEGGLEFLGQWDRFQGRSEGNLVAIPPGVTQGRRKRPSLAAMPLHKDLPRGENSSPRVALYPGCLIKRFYPAIGRSVYRVLRNSGLKVFLPPGLTCCGIPALYSGDYETARKLAIHNLEILKKVDPDYVVFACPSCGMALKNHFPELLADTSLAGDARELALRSLDFCQMAVKLTMPAPRGGVVVAQHQPCHQFRSLKTGDQARELLRLLPGIQVVDFSGDDRCCGFAGLYSFKNGEVSARLRQEKTTALTASGAEIVVTDCPGCIWQLRSGLPSRIPVIHGAQLTAVAMGIEEPSGMLAKAWKPLEKPNGI